MENLKWKRNFKFNDRFEVIRSRVIESLKKSIWVKVYKNGPSNIFQDFYSSTHSFTVSIV